jgi:hypothetical protein
MTTKSVSAGVEYLRRRWCLYVIITIGEYFVSTIAH